jgi:hypothetical protein
MCFVRFKDANSARSISKGGLMFTEIAPLGLFALREPDWLSEN